MVINIRVGFLIKEFLPKSVECILLKEDGIWLNVEKVDIVKVLKFLRFNQVMQYKQLLDITAVDYPGRKDRFEVVYSLLSFVNVSRLFLKLKSREIVESSVSVYKSAGWLEREVWDMFGIIFSGNFDLRRILTDYGFIGFPLRKDYPLSGYYEVR